MAAIDLTGKVITEDVINFSRKLANIKEVCQTARTSTTQDNIQRAYEVGYVAHSQLQALEATYTRAGLLQFATDFTNKDWNSFSVEYAAIMDVDLPAFLSSVEGLATQFKTDSITNGVFTKAGFNAGQTTGLQGDLDAVLVSFA